MQMNKISKRLGFNKIVSAGIVVVRMVDDEPLFLLLRSWNFWDSPKGRVEPGESDLEAAIRETGEEASIPKDKLDFKWGTQYHETEPYRKKKDKIGRYFVALTAQEEIELPINEELGKPEHEEYRWVTYDKAQEMTNARIGGVLKWANDKVKEGKENG